MNIMLHFEDLEPSLDDIFDPDRYKQKISEGLPDLLENLLSVEGKFKVKIIDYGYSRPIDAANGFFSKMGVPVIRAPETD